MKKTVNITVNELSTQALTRAISKAVKGKKFSVSEPMTMTQWKKNKPIKLKAIVNILN